MLRFFEEGGRAMSELLERPDAKVSPYSAASEFTQAAGTLADIARLWLADPAKLAEAQGSLISSYIDVWNASIRRLLGETVEPVVEPEPSDNRFKDPEWSSNPFFDFWKQAYLVTSHWAEDVLQQTEGLDESARRKAEFYLRQLSSAFSPSNFPLTNPEVVRETFATNARNLVQGMSQFAQDMEKSGDLLRITQTDTDAFEVGRNLATTPGKIVFENEV
ncbi:MAG: class I poly(R)-hydroxyalkanoic acid synthase, partial [Rhizobiales bacterium]|nr:class I poly(R)-hydroxyalkanoic acid synthase [Hyphomicrobiales bacterium]